MTCVVLAQKAQGEANIFCWNGLVPFQWEGACERLFSVLIMTRATTKLWDFGYCMHYFAVFEYHFRSLNLSEFACNLTEFGK